MTINPANEGDSVSFSDLNIAGSDLVASGDFVAIGPSQGPSEDRKVSTTSTSYVSDLSHFALRTQWDVWLSSGAQGAAFTISRLTGSNGDVRLRNNNDSETVHETLNLSAPTAFTIGPTNYTPTTTGSPIAFLIEWRTDDGATVTELNDSHVDLGVQV